MKLIIEIPDEDYKFIKDLQFYNSGRRSGRTIEQNMFMGIRNGIPYDERPQGEFTDLEQTAIADAINYLLGAELLEENGYTEEVINALKSVLQKIGAEENHL